MEDTVESKDQREHQGGDCACGFGVREGGDDHIRVSRGENEQLDAEQQDKSLALGRLDTSSGIDWVIVGGVDDDAEEDLVRDFDGDVC